MINKLVTFRLPLNVHEQIQEKCSDEGTTVSEKLRLFIDSYLHPSSQSKDAAPNEAEDGRKFDDEQLSILEGRITKIEDRIEKLDEPLGDIFNQLDNIEQVLPQALSAGAEDGSPEPGEIEAEHLDQAQGNPEEQKEEQGQDSGEEYKSGQHLELPFFKEKEKEPGKKDEGLG